jgi:hypothetical protein
MDLGEIGTEGAQQGERVENWADLDASDAESSSSEDEDESSEVFSGLWNPLNPEGETVEIDSDGTDDEDDEDDMHSQHCTGKKQRRRKQDPAKRNAILLAVVSLFLLYGFIQH